MKRRVFRSVTAYTLGWCNATDPRKEQLGAATFPKAAIADLFMHAEELLKSGYAVTIAPPDLASGTIPPAPRNAPALPSSVEIIDLQILS